MSARSKNRRRAARLRNRRDQLVAMRVKALRRNAAHWAKVHPDVPAWYVDSMLDTAIAGLIVPTLSEMRRVECACRHA